MKPTRYVACYQRGSHAVEWRGEGAWAALIHGWGETLGQDGTTSAEGLPSGRTDEYRANHRWPTPEAAMDALRAYECPPPACVACGSLVWDTPEMSVDEAMSTYGLSRGSAERALRQLPPRAL